MRLWSVYNLESGRIMRMLGQVKARNEQAAMAAKALKSTSLTAHQAASSVRLPRLTG